MKRVFKIVNAHLCIAFLGWASLPTAARPRLPSACTPHAQSHCAFNLPLLPPSSWVNIQGAQDASQVYSSYRISADLVRAITILSRNATQNIICHFLDTARQLTSSQLSSTVKILVHDHAKPYVAAFVDCPVPDNAQFEALALSTSANITIKTGHEDVVPIFSVARREDDVAVQVHPSSASNSTLTDSGALVARANQVKHTCLGVVYGKSPYNSVSSRDIAEFIEHHRHLGFAHFTFYTQSPSKDVERTLAFYESFGTVSTHKFEPSVAPSDVHELGQLAIVNDCHLRNRGRYTLFLQADVDEFIVPREGVDILSHLHSLLDAKERPIEIGLQMSFLFVAKNETQRLRATSRETDIHPYSCRSKYIARTDDVDEAGIHEIFKTVHGEPTPHRHVLPTSVAMLHHYRRANIEDGKVVDDISTIVGLATQPTQEDATMLAYLTKNERCVDGVVGLMEKLPSPKFGAREQWRRKKRFYSPV